MFTGVVREESGTVADEPRGVAWLAALLDLIAVALPDGPAASGLACADPAQHAQPVSMRGRLGVYVAAIILLIGACAALAVLNAEAQPRTRISPPSSARS